MRNVPCFVHQSKKDIPCILEMRGMSFLLDLLQKSIFDHKGTKSQREKLSDLVAW